MECPKSKSAILCFKIVREFEFLGERVSRRAV